AFCFVDSSPLMPCLSWSRSDLVWFNHPARDATKLLDGLTGWPPQGRHDELGLSRVRGRCRLGKDGVKTLGRIRSAQVRHNVMIAQQAGDAGERLQMISTGVFGRQEQENEID